MKKSLYFLISCWIVLIFVVACDTKKNTATNRRFHAFTARYNTYFNGKTSFDESLNAMYDGYKENYTEQIHMYPISAQPKDKRETGGPFDRAITKGNKAIKQHSIQKKPSRKPGWQSNPKMVAMQQVKEYNPFLKHCWLLVGQGQFYNADFLQASATFSYIARHYETDKEVVAEAKIWQARCYSELNWLHEAGTVLDNLEKNGFPEANHKQFDRFNADRLIKSGEFEQAVPYLQRAVKSEKNRRQRARMRYLLGQVYTNLGKNEAAYQAFRQVASANPPYELEFAARIRQTEVFPGGNYQTVLKMLNRMAKSSKNKDYLDQVYYAIGNIHMSRQDTAKAIENYILGIEKSTLNGMDKAICQIRLGDIYYTQRDYVNAQPCFSGALAGLSKEHKDYDRVYRLSAVLDELVVHVESVHLQDSLQVLAKMPESERLAVIDKIIEEVKKKEEEEAELAKREEYLAQQESIGDSYGQQRDRMPPSTISMPTMPGESSFYFYNSQLVAQGKNQFQSKWGKRALEDDWRRRNKAMSALDPLSSDDDASPALQYDEEGNLIEMVDSAQLAMDSLASDPKSREYYLQQIPLTEEDMEASNVIIADGLFNMGMIYKDGLENKDMSVETFEELERRFPDNKYRMDYYYHSFLMGLRYHDQPLTDKSKNKLIEAFPKSDYALAIADPNYEYNMRMMDRVQDSIYAFTYERYLASDTSAVRKNYRSFTKTYPLSTLIPKFMFLNALSYVQAGDAEGFKAALTELVDKYPQADVTELASEMLKGILRGRTLVQGDFTGMTWNLRFGLNEDGMLSAEDSARIFTQIPNAPHEMLLIYQTGSVDKNQLLYTVAAFNFANFEVQTFDMKMEEVGSVSLMTISGFNHLDEVFEYVRKIYAPGGYAFSLDRAVTFVPISTENAYTLMHGKTLEEYMAFFVEHYGDKLPELIARWRIQLQDENEKLAEAEDGMVERAAESVVDTDEEPLDDKVDTISMEDDEEEEEFVVEKDSTESIPGKKVDSEDSTWQESDSDGSVEDLETPSDTTQTNVTEDSVIKPQGEITLEQLEERTKLQQLEEKVQKEEEEKAQRLKRKEAEDDKKLKAKEREKQRKQKEKEAKERVKQKNKERKEKERQNRLKLKEKESQRKAAQKEKMAKRRK